MCMKQDRFIWLAFVVLMAMALAGTYVLGDNSGLAYLLLVPAFLILGAMGAADRPDVAQRSSE
jgi:hypothetical protein